MNVHSSTIHNTQMVEKIQTPISVWMNKQNVDMHTMECWITFYGWITIKSADTSYNENEPRKNTLSERNQHEKVTYCIISFIWNIQTISRKVKISFLGSSISCSKDLNSLLPGSPFLFSFLENEVVAEGGSILILITILKMDQY